jgi:hypothetical protein
LDVVLSGLLNGIPGTCLPVQSSLASGPTLNRDRTDVTGSLYLDVSSLRDNLVATDQEFLAKPGDNLYLRPDYLMFSAKGLYFADMQDIPTMNRKSAQDTFIFITTS